MSALKDVLQRHLRLSEQDSEIAECAARKFREVMEDPTDENSRQLEDLFYRVLHAPRDENGRCVLPPGFWSQA